MTALTLAGSGEKKEEESNRNGKANGVIKCGTTDGINNNNNVKKNKKSNNMPRRRGGPVMTDQERQDLPSALFLLSGTNPFRRAAVWLVRFFLFEWVIIITIIGEC